MLSGKELAEHAANHKMKILSSGYKLVEVVQADENLQKLKEIEDNFKYVTCLAKVDRQDSRSHGTYDDKKHRIKVTKMTKNVQKYFGTMENKDLYLKPYEALYLIEINDLLLYFDGIIVSVEQAYALLLGTENHSFEIEKYSAYSWLFRSGYIVQPFQLHQAKKDEDLEDEIDEKEQIWDNLSRNLNILNRRSALETVPSIKVVEEFESLRQQFLSPLMEEPPPSKKRRESLPNTDPVSFLDENDVVGYEKIFKLLRLVEEETVEPDLKEDLFDFSLYSSEKAGKFARSNPGKPDYYVKIVEINSYLDVNTLQRLVTAAGNVKVMLVIVFDNLSISSYICE